MAMSDVERSLADTYGTETNRGCIVCNPSAYPNPYPPAMTTNNYDYRNKPAAMTNTATTAVHTNTPGHMLTTPLRSKSFINLTQAAASSSTTRSTQLKTQYSVPSATLPPPSYTLSQTKNQQSVISPRNTQRLIDGATSGGGYDLDMDMSLPWLSSSITPERIITPTKEIEDNLDNIDDTNTNPNPNTKSNPDELYDDFLKSPSKKPFHMVSQTDYDMQMEGLITNKSLVGDVATVGPKQSDPDSQKSQLPQHKQSMSIVTSDEEYLTRNITDTNSQTLPSLPCDVPPPFPSTQQHEPFPHTTATTTTNNITNTIEHFKYIKFIQARGLLQYHLCQLRIELHKLFFQHRFSRYSILWSWIRLPQLSLLSMPRMVLNILRRWFPETFSIPYHTTWHSHVSQTESGRLNSNIISNSHILSNSPTSSSFTNVRPSLWSMNSLVSGIDGHATSEYHNFCRDLKILSAPDFEYCGCRKKDTARRMRISYQCLVPPL